MFSTKRSRGLAVVAVGILLNTAFYVAIAENPLVGLMLGFGIPAFVGSIGYAGWRAARWIERGE